MPKLQIEINNDTTKWNALKQSVAPTNTWTKSLPDRIDHQTNGQGICNAAANYGHAGFIYQSTSDLGTAVLHLDITQGKEDKANASSNHAGIKASCAVQNMAPDHWIFRVKWQVGRQD